MPLKILAISDDDSRIGELDCQNPDFLISCGDMHEGAILRMARYYGARHILAVRGNHDSAAPFPDPIIDLHLKTVAIEGITFGGFAGSWRYKLVGHHLYEQWDVANALNGFRPVDVFVAHNSPAGIHERDIHVHQGFKAFGEYIDRTQPQLFIHGHQHIDASTIRGQTTILSVFGERAITIES
ncbi:metallophosphoesterase [Prosthecobacter sp.]|uniref:metallophosphoesterase family protein n=1 Tax=Prosthecobacter sp. TaxID=1965333 RepID=UPI002AB8A4C0|nr:metallophosphoesterase [Prosthecobacter sp.]MDZ4405131.1 metallophosphoesterase [Prosthecobacter sp.]